MSNSASTKCNNMQRFFKTKVGSSLSHGHFLWNQALGHVNRTQCHCQTWHSEASKGKNTLVPLLGHKRNTFLCIWSLTTRRGSMQLSFLCVTQFCKNGMFSNFADTGRTWNLLLAGFAKTTKCRWQSSHKIVEKAWHWCLQVWDQKDTKMNSQPKMKLRGVCSEDGSLWDLVAQCAPTSDTPTNSCKLLAVHVNW